MSEISPETVKLSLRLECTFEVSPDHEPERLPGTFLDRDPSGWMLYQVQHHDWHRETFCPRRDSDFTFSPSPAGSAWDAFTDFAKASSTPDTWLLVGPGPDTVICQPEILPDRFRVWWVRETPGRAELVHAGDYLHRLSVLTRIKQLLAFGKCPVVASPYLGTADEFDTDLVVAEHA